MNKKLIGCALAIFAVLGVGTSEAGPIGLTAITFNGDRMVNDGQLGVTWADVALPDFDPWLYWSFGFGNTGAISSFINKNLNDKNYGGHNDWRAATINGRGYTNVIYPSFNGPAFDSTNCLSSLDELGSLFLCSLGNAYNSHSSQNFGPFISLKAQPYVGNSADYYFRTSTMSEGSIPVEIMNIPAHVIAVRSGVSQGIPVPEPALSWLLLGGLGGLGLMRYKRKA